MSQKGLLNQILEARRLHRRNQPQRTMVGAIIERIRTLIFRRER